MTAHEVFRIVCGQGGCNPEYFMDRMSISEAREYMEGVFMRERAGWRQTKAMAELFIKVMTGEEKDIPLPWDDETEAEGMTDEEYEEMTLKAEKMERFFNSKDKL